MKFKSTETYDEQCFTTGWNAFVCGDQLKADPASDDTNHFVKGYKSAERYMEENGLAKDEMGKMGLLL
jgi:hypothetical protein